MRLLIPAVAAGCANPNKNSGGCGPPGNVAGIIILAVLVSIVVLWLAFWVWARIGGSTDAPHTWLGRIVMRFFSVIVVGVGQASARRRRTRR